MLASCTQLKISCMIDVVVAEGMDVGCLIEMVLGLVKWCGEVEK